MQPRSFARRGGALAAVAFAALLVAGCSGEIAGNVTTSDPAVPESPTVGEGPSAAYAVLSCRDIAQEETALSTLAAPAAPPEDGALQERRSVLQALGKAKGCSSLTGRLTDTPPVRHQ